MSTHYGVKCRFSKLLHYVVFISIQGCSQDVKNEEVVQEVWGTESLSWWESGVEAP